VIPLLLGLLVLLAPTPAPGGDESAQLNPLHHLIWVAPGERIEAFLPSFGIPMGLYGPQQAREMWSRIRAADAPRLTASREIPLPNVTGKFKFLLMEFRVQNRPVWIRIILRKSGERWAVQSVREVQRF
jgi:hypothetical protein